MVLTKKDYNFMFNTDLNNDGDMCHCIINTSDTTS